MGRGKMHRLKCGIKLVMTNKNKRLRLYIHFTNVWAGVRTNAERLTAAVVAAVYRVGAVVAGGARPSTSGSGTREPAYRSVGLVPACRVAQAGAASE